MTWRLRVWFQDASGTVSHTGAWMRSPNETAIFAFVDALRGLSNAQITRVDVYRFFPYESQVPSGRDQSIGMFVQPAYNPVASDNIPRDAFAFWAPESTPWMINDLWGYVVTALGFVSRAGYNMYPPVIGDGQPQSLDNTYPDGSDDYYLVAIRRNFWHKLLRDSRTYNTLSMSLPDEQARRVRLDIRDLFLGVPMQEIINRLDTIIQLLQQDDPNIDEIESLLMQLIDAIGAP